MPYARRRYNRRRPAYRRRRIPGLATRPRMMPRTLALKRYQQVGTRVFWFKQNGNLSTNLIGDINYSWRTRDMMVQPAPYGIQDCFNLYDQYKILALKVKFFPAFVGAEPDATLFPGGGLQRGDTVVWSDQRFDPGAQLNVLISQVINNASAKMINSRRPYSRTIYRSRGNPHWGSCQDYQAVPDPWSAAVEILGNNYRPSATPTTPGQVFWYYTVQWKVLFRGRRQ